jgi:hypothetical protein
MSHRRYAVATLCVFRQGGGIGAAMRLAEGAISRGARDRTLMTRFGFLFTVTFLLYT